MKLSGAEQQIFMGPSRVITASSSNAVVENSSTGRERSVERCDGLSVNSMLARLSSPVIYTFLSPESLERQLTSFCELWLADAL